ncbi:11699_t:CDS:2, partial [Funneliformis caledonium]
EESKRKRLKLSNNVNDELQSYCDFEVQVSLPDPEYENKINELTRFNKQLLSEINELKHLNRQLLSENEILKINQGYKTENQLGYFKKCADHHKAWDSVCNIYQHAMAIEL